MLSKVSCKHTRPPDFAIFNKSFALKSNGTFILNGSPKQKMKRFENLLIPKKPNVDII